MEGEYKLQVFKDLKCSCPLAHLIREFTPVKITENMDYRLKQSEHKGFAPQIWCSPLAVLAAPALTIPPSHLPFAFWPHRSSTPC